MTSREDEKLILQRRVPEPGGEARKKHLRGCLVFSSTGARGPWGLPAEAFSKANLKIRESDLRRAISEDLPGTCDWLNDAGAEENDAPEGEEILALLFRRAGLEEEETRKFLLGRQAERRSWKVTATEIAFRIREHKFAKRYPTARHVLLSIRGRKEEDAERKEVKVIACRKALRFHALARRWGRLKRFQEIGPKKTFARLILYFAETQRGIRLGHFGEGRFLLAVRGGGRWRISATDAKPAREFVRRLSRRIVDEDLSARLIDDVISRLEDSGFAEPISFSPNREGIAVLFGRETLSTLPYPPVIKALLILGAEEGISAKPWRVEDLLVALRNTGVSGLPASARGLSSALSANEALLDAAGLQVERAQKIRDGYREISILCKKVGSSDIAYGVDSFDFEALPRRSASK